ncbi:MAG: hypothetical protein KUG81_06870, partial [Gammaproteobacteria bacterium]|nr:hypothetical protein [Gammaproteobacteria bacterium]
GDRSELLDKVWEYRELYHKEPGGFDSDEHDGPWENASNLHIPMITDKVETATPKVMSAMWRANPFVNVKRPGGSDFNVEKTKNIENFLSWAFRNDIPNFYMTFENFLRNMFIDGTSFAKIRWERKMRRAIETFTVDSHSADEQNGHPVQRPIEDILEEIFGLGDVEQTLFQVDQVSDSVFNVGFTEGGEQFSGRAELFSTERIDRIKVRVFRNIIERESPMIDLVELDDIVFPFRSTDLQSADWVAHKTWYTYKEVEKLVADKDWALTREQMGVLKGNRRHADTENDHEQAKDEWTGAEGQKGQHLPTPDEMIDPNRILVWEIYTEDYVDADNEPINVVHFVPEIIRCVAGTEYHDEIFEHGQRPFVSATYIPISGRVYGTGMAELLYGINLSIDHTINTVHNNMAITTNPMGFYSPMSMAQNHNSTLKIKPGEMVPVMNPREVFFPNFGQQPLESMHATFNLMQGAADSLTFSPTVGGSTNFRNAPRTAKGTSDLMNAAEEKLATIVEQLQATAWLQMIKQVSSLYGAHLSIGKWYDVTGEVEARHISPKELRENFIFEFSGSLTSVNRDIQMTRVQQLYQMLAPEQEYQQDPVAKNNLRRALVQSFGGNLDVESVLPKPPGQGGFDHQPWTQDEENRAMSQGEFISVLPSDNDQEHIEDIGKFEGTEVYMALPDVIKGMIHAHKQAHEAAAKQKMQASQRAAENQGTGQALQGANPVAEPGSPNEGQVAQGGELSALGGFQ